MRKNLSIPLLTRNLFSIIVLLLGSLPLPVSAMDTPYFMGNDIFYFDGATGSACSTVGTAYSTMLDIPTLTGADNPEKVWNFLTTQAGLSPEQAAGIMGNLAQESGPDIDPAAVEGNGIGFGIAQWSYERRNGHPKEDQGKGFDPIGGIEKS